MYLSLHFEELHALNSILIVATLCSYSAPLYCMALLVLCFGTLHTACLLDGGGCLLFWRSQWGVYNSCRQFMQRL